MDYLKRINNYGLQLSECERKTAHDLFLLLLKKGWDYEMIFHGIRLLKGRSIAKYKPLFLSQDYSKQVKDEVENVRAMRSKLYKDKLKELELLLQYGISYMPQEYKQRLIELDNYLVNSQDIEQNKAFTDEELQIEVKQLYELCIIEPSLLFPLSELDEDDRIARQSYYCRK